MIIAIKIYATVAITTIALLIACTVLYDTTLERWFDKGNLIDFKITCILEKILGIAWNMIGLEIAALLIGFLVGAYYAIWR